MRTVKIFEYLGAFALIGCTGQTLAVGSGPPEAGASHDGSLSSFGAPTFVEQHLLDVPETLAADGVDIFWSDQAPAVWRDPIAGGAPVQIASGTLIAIDSTNVYFIDYAAGTAFASVPKGGGPTSTLITVSGSVSAATVVGGTVFWAGMADATPPGLPTSTIKSAPLVAGGTVTTLGSVPSIDVNSIAVTGSTIFLTIGSAHPGIFQNDGGVPMAIDAGTAGCTTVFAGPDGAYCSGGALILVATDGTTTTVIASETNNATHMALDATNVYWTNETASGSVVMAPKNGGANVTISYDTNPLAIAVDDGAVYWSDNAGNIQRASKP